MFKVCCLKVIKNEHDYQYKAFSEEKCYYALAIVHNSKNNKTNSLASTFLCNLNYHIPYYV
jgi:hypothetical protein